MCNTHTNTDRHTDIKVMRDRASYALAYIGAKAKKNNKMKIKKKKIKLQPNMHDRPMTNHLQNNRAHKMNEKSKATKKKKYVKRRTD